MATEKVNTKSCVFFSKKQIKRESKMCTFHAPPRERSPHLWGLCSPLLALPPQEPPSHVGSGHPVPDPSSRCPGSDAHPGPQGPSSDLPLARLALPTQDPGTALVREPGRVRKGEGRAPHLTLCRPGDATCGSAALASLRAREGDAENETLHSPTF